MENAVRTRLQAVRFGEVQHHKNMAIVPLLCPDDGKFQYLTLGEALATWNIAVTEVSASGSVPELLVVNRGNKPVLLVDGEELAGAKQNRVLNTSILLKKLSQTKIPVSCTESGRWSYASKCFGESGNVMDHKSRSRKARAVQCSLEASGVHESNQGQVWQDIAALQSKAGASSATSAMSDVFKAREEDLKKCIETFQCMPNQVGLLAIIDGQPAGMDMVSLSSAYTRIHPKLVRSYTLEGLLNEKAKHIPADGITARAKEFLAEITSAQECRFPSVGHGTDHRYKGEALAGTALIHEKEVIHACFFRLDEPEESGNMASCSTPDQNRRTSCGG